MQLLTIISAAFLVGANAVALDKNPVHVADFRSFGGDDCKTGNNGIYTVYDDQFENGECLHYNADGSVLLQKSVILNDIIPTCKFTVYETADCSDAGQVLEPTVCNVDINNLLSWAITCEE